MNLYSFSPELVQLSPVLSVPIPFASHNPTNQYINFRQGVQQWGKRIYNLSYTEEELRKWQEELEALQKTSKYSKTSAGSNNTATSSNTSTQDCTATPANAAPTPTNTAPTLKSLCKRTTKEISNSNTVNKHRYKELQKCTNVEHFFKGYTELKDNQKKIKQLKKYLNNPELTVFPSTKDLDNLLRSFVQQLANADKEDFSWFSQVSHHFSVMTESQIAFVCSLAKVC